MRQLTMILLCGLLAMAVPIRARRIVKNPDALGCLNVTGGELRVREVMFADTATTVRFTIDYPAGHNFRISDTCYLLDEKDRRYPLRSAEGLSVNTWVISPDSVTTDFTLHFEPLPRRTRVFDFIEYDGQGAFMDAATYEAEFMVGLSGLIAEIYDKDLPFSPTDNKMRCNTCPFASLCK